MITPVHVLTAAHCVDKVKEPDDIKIYFDNFLTPKGFTARAKKIFIASNLQFTEIPMIRDLAIIELSSGFHFTQPICLPYIAEEYMRLNLNLTLNGYSGAGFHVKEIEVFDAKHCFLKYNSVKISEKLRISDRVPKPCDWPLLNLHDIHRFDEMDNNTFFNWYEHKYFCSLERTSNGDSGGPMMLEVAKDTWTLIGIASNTFGAIYRPFLCHDFHINTVLSGYQTISSNLPWIRNVIDSYNRWDPYFYMFNYKTTGDRLLHFNRVLISNLILTLSIVIVIVSVRDYNEEAKLIISAFSSMIILYNWICFHYQ